MCVSMLCACSWDRVVPESYLLQNTDENRMLMRKLTVISQKEWVLLLCCLVSFWMWTSTPHCFDTAGSSSWLIVAVIFKQYEHWEGTVSRSQSKEASILWSHHEETRELPGERDNARNNCTQARKTTHGLDGQHQDVDRTPRGRVYQNDRGQR